MITQRKSTDDLSMLFLCACQQFRSACARTKRIWNRAAVVSPRQGIGGHCPCDAVGSKAKRTGGGASPQQGEAQWLPTGG